MRYFWLALFGLICVVPVQGMAQTPLQSQLQKPSLQSSAAVISGVKIEGTQRIEPATVMSYLSLKAGDRFEPNAVNQSLKALFATGYFSDIQLFREGSLLVVKIVENPIINEIAFEGNDEAKEEDLLSETQLRPRIVYTRAKVQEDVQRLLQIYRRMGHYSATIDPKIIKLDQNRVNLVYEIHEGKKTKVRAINFVGNVRFSDGALREVIQTRETRWYRFLTSDDNYDADRIAYDEELLRKFYLSKGYADFTVKSSVAELTPDQKDFFLTYTITEGERYRLGSVNINSRIKGMDNKALNPHIKTKKGDWYNVEKVDTSISEVTDELANQQFAFAEVKPDVSLDRKKREVNLNYVINESPRVFVERIDISSNTRTLDKVIRREMRLVEGDPFNRTKLKKSEQKLRDLNFFRNVSVKTIPGSRPDLAIIKVEVEEQSTGELSVGAGFSTSDGPLGDFRIRERNFLGKGQDLQLATTISGRTQEYDLKFTEPYFLDRNLSAGIDLFHTTTDYQDESSYDQARSGGGVRVGYPLSENWRQDFNYTLQNNEIRNISTDASRYIIEQEGQRITSSIGQALTYSTIDNRMDPTEGILASISNDVAGFGGDAKYISNKVKGASYWPLSDDRLWIFSTAGEVGYIIGFDNDVRINERYFLGGATFRGFDTAGIGPRDLSTNDALGGNRYAKGNVELTTPIGSATKELGVRSHFFTEFGTLGQLDSTGADIVDQESLRLSVGFGISWRSPMGPLRGDLALPIIKEEYDEKRIFNFSFGTRF
jgi:outer membrane protein insertion porin family